jgi:Uma2 family endonuclease
MVANLEATIEDLYAVKGKAEIVNGEIVHLPPAGAASSYAAGAILASLAEYCRRTRNGYPVGGNAAFVVTLASRKSFSPDAAFYSGEWPGMKFFERAPDFAVEVRDEGDYGPAAEAAIAKKRVEYFAAGTFAVWEVNLLGEDVIKLWRSYAPEAPRIFRRGDTAEAELAVPGWSMPVDDLFIEVEN